VSAQAREIDVSRPCDFSEALARMKHGMPMRRRAWAGKVPYKGKLEIWIHEGKIRTQYVSYMSDQAVLQSAYILADDWIPFDEK
jgi:hypothetical protein